MNLYRALGNGPTGWLDPNGLVGPNAPQSTHVTVGGETVTQPSIWQRGWDLFLDRDQWFGRTVGLQGVADRLAAASLDENGTYVGVGQPALLEGMIPFWGPMRSVIDHAQRGEWGWAYANAAMAGLDLTGIGYFGRSGLRLGWQGLRQLPRAWRALRNTGARLWADDAAHLGARIRNALEGGGFARGITAEEITAINRQLGGATTLTADVSTVLANAARWEGLWNKATTIVQDIAGRHLFNDANTRTAQAVVEELMRCNGITSGVSSNQMRRIIQRVASGELREVEDTARALRGF